MIQQVINQLRQQPVLAAVTVAGTALSIFLIMLVVMLEQVRVAPFAPESNRNRFLHSSHISLTNQRLWGESGTSNGPMSERAATELYKKLSTPEAVTMYQVFRLAQPIGQPGQVFYCAEIRATDGDYFRVFDLRPLKEEGYGRVSEWVKLFDGSHSVVVLTEKIARQIFGHASKAIGQEVMLNYAPYRVVGVVKDVSTLATKAYAEAWIPYRSWKEFYQNTNFDNLMGDFSVTILARRRSDFPAIRQECEQRLKEFNQEVGLAGYKVLSQDRPYDQEQISIVLGGSNKPDVKRHRATLIVTLVILLLVPAINLSSMTQSRMRQRVEEIGIRRAFGCTRRQVVLQVLNENLIITLLGGLLGLLLGVAFSLACNEMLFDESFIPQSGDASVTMAMLLRPATFLLALLFCFMMNLLSSGLTAWWAASVNIVNALNRR